MSTLTHLECSYCGKEYDADVLQTLCPEGGATLAALEKLLAKGWIGKEEKVVLFNTGTGLKYPEAT